VEEDLLEPLNPAQREAVTAPPGPILVLAGAGSGKTRAIAHRVAYLIRERRVPPESILAVTFTNKAAGEMRGRIAELAGATAKSVAIHTFHAFCLRLLRAYGEAVALPRNFVVYDEDDRRALLRRVRRELGASERDFPAGRLAAALSAKKNQADDSPRAYGGRWERENEAREKIFAAYQRALQAAGAVDFDDLLTRAVELLSCSEPARDFVGRRCQHVLVDEYQDTNRVQYQLLRLLAPHRSLFVVGDEDQSIYTFRGADLRNILEFERDFPQARLIKLEENYRSTGAILAAASRLIGHNQERKGKRLLTRAAAGARPRIHEAATDAAEAVFVASQVEALRSEGRNQTVAVLYRTHAQSRLFEEEFLRRRLPHVLVGGQRFYERREVKDALAYLRLLANPHDDASFLRVANVPPRGIGAATLEALERAAAERGLSLWDTAAALLEERALPARAAQGLRALLELRTALAAARESLPLAALVEQTLERSGLLAALRGESSAEAQGRIENLQQLMAAAAEQQQNHPSLESFLDHASLLTDLDAVRAESPCLLMTLHSAKGLEFDSVFLTGMEEGLFPHLRSLGSRRAIEEERRLCYVGMTRARRQLALTYARARYQALEQEGRTPSRFLEEVGRELADYAVPASRRQAAPSRARWGRRRPEPAGAEAESDGPVHPGMRVRHPLFGEGTVLDSESAGGEQKLTVRFGRVGTKKLVARYARLEVIA
jgi:DNA helicase-2/ATP-dependent DNA helicase PcrA